MNDSLVSSVRTQRILSGTIALRVIAFTAVFAAAVAGLSAGVGVSERDLSGVGLAERAYYALGLFVLGGLDIGTPVGGPPVGRALLWSAYFGAPIITAFAIVEAVLRIFGLGALRLRRLSGHVVIGGDWNLRLAPTAFPHNTADRFLFWIRDFPAALTPEGWAWAVDPERPTVRTAHQPYRTGENYRLIIDGFLLSPNVALLDAEADDLDFANADHNPVRIRVTAREKPAEMETKP